MKILTYKNTPVRLHYSFILFAVVLFLFELILHGISSASSYLLVGLALYFSVILHEFGHVIMAQRFGISTKEIVLYPFGGIAFINAAKFNPKSEFFIAIAGPLVNAIVAILFTAIAVLTNSIFAYYIIVVAMLHIAIY